MFSLVHQHLCVIILLRQMIRGEEPKSLNNCMALAIYEPSKIFETFQSKIRQFEFAGRTISIGQDWEKNGVAAVVWDAAVVLARYLETAGDLAQKKVIELGAGTGLVGLVACLLGAHVILTDRKMALDLARDNLQRNIDHLNGSMIEVRELEWGQTVSGFDLPFDYILGADIVYIEETFSQLGKSISELSDMSTTVLLSCKLRYERERKFLKMLSKQFDIEEVFYDESVDIYIYKAMKRLTLP